MQSMDKAKAIQILNQLKKREDIKSIDILKDSFPAQIAFVKDQSRRKVGFTNRRGGKSSSVALMLFYYCLQSPNTQCLYVGLTEKTAKKVILPILKQFNQKYHLNAKFIVSPAGVKFDNNSEIHFFGLNNADKEKEKLLGLKLKLAVVDECASYTIDLEQALREHIAPTLIDERGQLVLIGTPGDNKNYYYHVSEGRIPGWAVHKWSALDNPYVAKQFQEELDDQRRMYPNIDSDPGFRQHYLGEWTTDDSKKAYRCSEHNFINSLPDGYGEYTYILGMDLGWGDANAWVVCAYNQIEKILYIIESYSQPNMLMDEWIEKLAEIEKRYPISQWIIDAAGKNYVEELKARTNRPFQNKPGAGQDKMKFVHMMNSDFIKGKIKVIKNNCLSLLKEYDVLTINSKNPVKPFIVGGDHNADAALYAWRFSYHYLSESPVIAPKKTDLQLMDEYWEEEENKLNNKNNSSWLDRDWKF